MRKRAASSGALSSRGGVELIAPVLTAAIVGTLHQAVTLALFTVSPHLLRTMKDTSPFVQPAIAIFLAWGAWRLDGRTKLAAGWPGTSARYATVAHAGLAFLLLFTPLRYDNSLDWLRLLDARDTSESIAHALLAFCIAKLLAIRNARRPASCAWVMGGVSVAVAVVVPIWSHPFLRMQLLRLASCTALLVATVCWAMCSRVAQPSHVT